jgi:hypothetical protein
MAPYFIIPLIFLLIAMRILGGPVFRRGKRFHARSRRRPAWFLRRIEAFAVLAVGLFYLLYIGNQIHVFSRIETPGPEGVTPYVLILLTGFLAITLAHFLALFGGTRAAFAVLLVLVFLGWPVSQVVLRRTVPDRYGPRVLPGAPLQRFDVDPPAEGVELWVNGVCLGEPPLSIPRKEFLEKVPRWTDPPEGYDEELAKYNANQIENRELACEVENRRTPWFEFLLNEDNLYFHGPRKERDDLYYARLELGNEFAVGRGFANTSSFRNRSAHTVFRGEFPEYEARLDHLIDQGRILGSKVDSEWFRTLDSHGKYGRQLFWDAVEEDPALEPAADAWARWKFDFDRELDAQTAWRVLEKVRADAERTADYQSRSIAGRAVELAAPHLDPDRLAEETVHCLRENRSRTFFHHRVENEKPRIGLQAYESSTPLARLALYPLLDASLLVDARLDSSDVTAPNVIERRVPPELLCWWQTDDGYIQGLDVVTSYGGPVVERFLLRQDLESDDRPTAGNWIFGGRVVGGSRPRTVNQYFLNHTREVLEAAETILRKAPGFDRSPVGVPFLFYHPERGKDSLAARFWPRYLALSENSSYPSRFQLEGMFEYLARMEPYPSVEMYLDCWREHASEWFSSEALNALSDLPDAKHKAVLTAILEDVEENPSYYLSHFRGSDADREYVEEVWPKRVRERIQNIPEGAAERATIEKWIESGTVRDQAGHFSKDPDSFLVAVAARHENPDVRLITRGALIEHPSETNQKLLAELLNDPDERVGTAAKEAKQELEKLAAAPPSEFAHPLAGGSQ